LTSNLEGADEVPAAPDVDSPEVSMNENYSDRGDNDDSISL